MLCLLPGPVTIRNMMAKDADFAGRMSVEAFRSKFEWAAGRRKYDLSYFSHKFIQKLIGILVQINLVIV